MVHEGSNKEASTQGDEETEAPDNDAQEIITRYMVPCRMCGNEFNWESGCDLVICPDCIERFL